jgi:hypothetical protein
VITLAPFEGKTSYHFLNLLPLREKEKHAPDSADPDDSMTAQMF